MTKLNKLFEKQHRLPINPYNVINNVLRLVLTGIKHNISMFDINASCTKHQAYQCTVQAKSIQHNINKWYCLVIGQLQWHHLKLADSMWIVKLIQFYLLMVSFIILLNVMVLQSQNSKSKRTVWIHDIYISFQRTTKFQQPAYTSMRQMVNVHTVESWTKINFNIKM